jgi:alpha-tubulin suppressor-like RCC1 family protein
MRRAVIVAILLLFAGLHFMSTRDAPPATPAPTAAVSAQVVRGVLAAGPHYLLALDSSGRVIGWGGIETGNGERLLSASRRPQPLVDGEAYQQVSAGNRTILAIDVEGSIWRASLVEVAEGRRQARRIFEGHRWRMAFETWGIGVGIDRAGALWYWHDDEVERALGGPGGSADDTLLRALEPGTTFIDACLQGTRLHAINARGRMLRSLSLQRTLTDPDASLQGERSTLDALDADAPLVHVACRENASHVMALDGRGRIWGYGIDTFGELGAGASAGHEGREALAATTLRLLSERNWLDLAVGPSVTLAIATDGSLWAWGRNADGELGVGDTDSHDGAVLVGASGPWSAVAAGYGNAVALAADGSLHAWGNNALGVLGDGGIAGSHLSPQPVLSDVRFGGAGRD